MNFDALPATETIDAGPPGWALPLTLLSIFVFVGLVIVSARLSKRTSLAPSRWLTLALMPPAARILVTVTLLALLLVQAMAAFGVYYQTRVVHGSASEYFEYLSVARLIGTSHAHLFGYAVLYGLIGLIATCTEASERTKTFIVATLLWSGVFDVLSWWGIKFVTPDFEWLSLTTALGSASASLFTLYWLARSVRARPA